MRRVLPASGIVGLIVVVVVAAQPPGPPPGPPVIPAAPPAAPPVVPPAAPGEPTTPKPPSPLPTVGTPAPTMPPAATTETPLSKFDPLTAFPPVTQYSVRAVLLGATWLTKMHQPHGRFTYGYVPALRQPMNGDHDLKQAQAALAMAQAAKFAGDEKQAAIASQTILALLASTKVAPNEPAVRVPVQMSFSCNRVGFAATLALAIYELPKPDEKLIEDAERLCEFVRRHLRTDGSVHYTDGPNDTPTQIDPNGMNEYPGFALQALAMSNRVRPAEWKKDAVQRGVAHYHTIFRAKPHPMLAATITPAAAELYAQTKLPELVTAAFEMNDWLCTLQILTTDARTPQWAGGFRPANAPTADPLSTAETAMFVQSLACAYYLTRFTGDLTREAKYRPAAADAAQFLCASQFLEANTRHFENTFRAGTLIGAFHLSPSDGNLRVDATACAISGLLRYLAASH